jgi:hypothetical protein
MSTWTSVLTWIRELLLSDPTVCALPLMLSLRGLLKALDQMIEFADGV